MALWLHIPSDTVIYNSTGPGSFASLLRRIYDPRLQHLRNSLRVVNFNMPYDGLVSSGVMEFLNRMYHARCPICFLIIS
jgi:hypothetical protein